MTLPLNRRRKIWIIILGPKDTGKTSFLVQFANLISFAMNELNIPLKGKLQISPTETTTVDRDMLSWKLNNTNINFIATGGGFLSEIVRNRNNAIYQGLRSCTSEKHILILFILGHTFVTRPSLKAKDTIESLSEILVKQVNSFDFKIEEIPILTIINKADRYYLKEGLIDEDFMSTLSRRLSEVNPILFNREKLFKIIKGYSKIGGIEKIYIVNTSPRISFSKLLKMKKDIIPIISSTNEINFVLNELNELKEEIKNPKISSIAISTVTDFLEYINENLYIDEEDKRIITSIIEYLKRPDLKFFDYIGLNSN